MQRITYAKGTPARLAYILRALYSFGAIGISLTLMSSCSVVESPENLVSKEMNYLDKNNQEEDAIFYRENLEILEMLAGAKTDALQKGLLDESIISDTCMAARQADDNLRGVGGAGPRAQSLIENLKSGINCD